MAIEETISMEFRKTELDKQLQEHKTTLHKQQFIEEIKGVLGTEIKSNPTKINIIKKPWCDKLKKFLANLFTKF